MLLVGNMSKDIAEDSSNLLTSSNVPFVFKTPAFPAQDFNLQLCVLDLFALASDVKQTNKMYE